MLRFMFNSSHITTVVVPIAQQFNYLTLQSCLWLPTALQRPLRQAKGYACPQGAQQPRAPVGTPRPRDKRWGRGRVPARAADGTARPGSREVVPFPRSCGLAAPELPRLFGAWARRGSGRLGEGGSVRWTNEKPDTPAALAAKFVFSSAGGCCAVSCTPARGIAGVFSTITATRQQPLCLGGLWGCRARVSPGKHLI